MIVATSKKFFFAAVGAPVVAAHKLSDRFTELGSKLGEDLSKEYDLWALEGEKVVHKVTDRKAVEEFVEDVSARMDFDQIQEQVGKLREQLEEMLANWRSSFRPASEKPEVATTASTPEAPEAEQPPAAETGDKTASSGEEAAEEPVAEAAAATD